MAFQANCPACGAPVEFTVKNSVVTVCPSCRSAVGRGDGALQNLGKIADLVQTDTPLRVGLRGKFKGVPFEVMGRAQIRHSAGGLWDEWYLAFRGGQRWGWLADAQGRLYLTFDKDFPKTLELPAPQSLSAEDEVVLPGIGTMRVAEVGQGRYASAEGEIPYQLVPGETFHFADLSGGGRKFATIDWSGETPTVYAGGEVTLAQIGLADALSAELEARRVTAVQVNCPKCGGPLELQAPDESQRVACPYCGALLSCDHGKLEFLQALGKQKVDPQIPLGTVGRFDPAVLDEDWSEPREYTIIGFLQRKVIYEGNNYYWEEYLLYRPRSPFCWLICNEGHWSFGQSLPAGDVVSGARTAYHEGRNFVIYDRGEPQVNWVVGEFYWKVRIGETVHSADYISPPYMLSREMATADDSREINYTLLHYLPVAEVEKAFGVKLPEPRGVAPNQPYGHTRIYKMFAALLAAAVLIGLLVSSSADSREILTESYQFQPGQPTEILRPLPKPLHSGENIRVKITATPWVYVSGEIFNPQTGSKRDFGLPSGEAVYLSSLPEGNYELRLRVKWESMSTSSPFVAVQIHQDVPRWSPFLWLLVGLAVVPAGVAAHHMSFNYHRWENSDYSPYQSE